MRPALLVLAAAFALATVTPALAGDGQGGPSKLGSLVAACRASSSGDAWKACVKSRLGAHPDAGSRIDSGPGTRPPRPVCNAAAGARSGPGCATKLGALLASCASSSGADWKACVRSKLARPDGPQKGPDPARVAQAVCNGPLGRKLGSGCVDTLTALFTACEAQASSGRDVVKACVRTGLASAVGQGAAPTL